MVLLQLNIMADAKNERPTPCDVGYKVLVTPNRATTKDADHEKSYHIRRFGYT